MPRPADEASLPVTAAKYATRNQTTQTGGNSKCTHGVCAISVLLFWAQNFPVYASGRVCVCALGNKVVWGSNYN